MDQTQLWLKSRLKHHRWEIIADYITSPLRFGPGFKEFDVFDFILPVFLVGPHGVNVPGGAMVTPDGVPKFPANTYNDGVNLRDQLEIRSVRNYQRESTYPSGSEAMPSQSLGNYRAFSKQIACVGGAAAASAFQAVAGTRQNEIWVDHIAVLAPTDAVPPVPLTFTFAVSAGALVSNSITIVLHYIWDFTNNIIRGKFIQTFPGGLRLQATTPGAEVTVAVANGLDVETIEIGYHSRMDTNL